MPRVRLLVRCATSTGCRADRHTSRHATATGPRGHFEPEGKGLARVFGEVLVGAASLLAKLDDFAHGHNRRRDLALRTQPRSPARRRAAVPAPLPRAGGRDHAPTRS